MTGPLNTDFIIVRCKGEDDDRHIKILRKRNSPDLTGYKFIRVAGIDPNFMDEYVHEDLYDSFLKHYRDLGYIQ